MAEKRDVGSLMRRELGKRTADAMLNKLDKMAKRGVKPEKIETALCEDLADSITREVGVVAKSKVKGGVLIASRLSKVATPARMKPRR